MRTPLVIAHQGSRWDEPGNTIPAFERAIADGADYVEFDVRAGPDGRLVVAHDPVRRPPGPEVPSLDEVLECCAGRVGIALELKEGAVTEAALAALDRRDLDPDDVMVLSFGVRSVEKVRRLRPELRTVLHLDRRSVATAATRFWGVGFADRRARARPIAQAQRLGLATTVYTVNEPERMRELAALGVTGIFSDRPGLLRSVLHPDGG